MQSKTLSHAATVKLVANVRFSMPWHEISWHVYSSVLAYTFQAE